MNSMYRNGFTVNPDDNKETAYVSFATGNESLKKYYLLNHDGTLMHKETVEWKQEWEVPWSTPGTDCDVYGKCGALGSCNSKDSPIYKKRNMKFLTAAWRLWNEGNSELLIDPRLTCQDFQMEILRCIHIGLLCVQEFATERPNMSTVLSMLSSEIANLPKPKQPAFTQRPVLSERHSSQPCTNGLTVTIAEG
ncbi:hypothetical protein C3L33_07748, partial [Rhododendron williamsianum]